MEKDFLTSSFLLAIKLSGYNFPQNTGETTEWHLLTPRLSVDLLSEKDEQVTEDSSMVQLELTKPPQRLRPTGTALVSDMDRLYRTNRQWVIVGTNTGSSLAVHATPKLHPT